MTSLLFDNFIQNFILIPYLALSVVTFIFKEIPNKSLNMYETLTYFSFMSYIYNIYLNIFK